MKLKIGDKIYISEFGHLTGWEKIIKITGMHCNSCAMNIELELEDKVNSIKVNYATGEAEIDFDPKKISESRIKETIKKLGYETP